ncbi:MAG: hypothetical protein H6746_15730 [Deltaproteobacteria bacterium]|nr:hypothetical protein [Deltaproteobacteria bacterium]
MTTATPHHRRRLRSGRLPGDVLPCDDSNPGTSDACDPQTAPCAATPLDGGACDDGSPCTENGVCGRAVHHEATDCDDGDPARPTRTEAEGCTHQPWTGECDDGDPCTTADQCATGVCAGVALDCSGRGGLHDGRLRVGPVRPHAGRGEL